MAPIERPPTGWLVTRHRWREGDDAFARARSMREFPSRRFRFGVVSGRAQSGAEWVAKARHVEELGYSTLLVPDHIAVGVAPIAAMSVAAAATTTLRVGSLVFSNDFRNPAWLAKEMATLDLLSDGRVELGLGAGYLPMDYAQTGIPFDPPAVRIARLEEAIRLIKRSFVKESVSQSGTYYRIEGLQGRPRPVQRPHPPIFVGGAGKRLLAMAAREADSIGVGFTVWRNEISPVTPEEVEAKVRWVCDAAGERVDQIELGYTVFNAVVADGRADLPKLPNLPDLPRSPHVLAGTAEQIVDEIVERRERYGFSYVQVMEQVADAFAPVVARLAGH